MDITATLSKYVKKTGRLEEYVFQAQNGNAPQLIELLEYEGKGAREGIFKCQICGNLFKSQIGNILSRNTNGCGCVRGFKRKALRECQNKMITGKRTSNEQF